MATTNSHVNYEEIVRGLVSGTKTSFTVADYPSGITRLGDSFGCAGMTYIEIPVGVTIPGFWINGKRTSLLKVKFEEGTTVIGETYALQTNIKGFVVDVPSTVTGIAKLALNLSGQDTVILMRPVVPPTFGESKFAIAFKGTIYVPDESVDAYKAVTALGTYTEQIKPLSEYVEL